MALDYRDVPVYIYWMAGLLVSLCCDNYMCLYAVPVSVPGFRCPKMNNTPEIPSKFTGLTV